MSENEKKPMTVGHSLSSSAGLGTLITCLASAYDTDLTAKFAPAIPIVSSALTFLVVWGWNRWGCESPEIAAVRNKLGRDAKELKKLIKDPDISEATKAQARQEYEQTKLQLATLGRFNHAKKLASSEKIAVDSQAS